MEKGLKGSVTRDVHVMLPREGPTMKSFTRIILMTPSGNSLSNGRDRKLGDSTHSTARETKVHDYLLEMGSFARNFVLEIIHDALFIVRHMTDFDRHKISSDAVVSSLKMNP